ncbi:Vps54-like protein (macronuclear) [Tetrahymena thermophila SB210]|uniref:Vps54-like protein n=1 Tax=Tetrahymena thermophila (strain SB210) TaxID=312017 RepID=I7M7F7_TETTS|nr:Vps54-like protein [Tetrahymena thermophila SB210]EAR92916.1 Vps54-like protein [Tetrahymena thermophila SB210]|eukprot:XP_001013161.1 Vps54-like protein [Tetrahymena thermophila SB210]
MSNYQSNFKEQKSQDSHSQPASNNSSILTHQSSIDKNKQNQPKNQQTPQIQRQTAGLLDQSASFHGNQGINGGLSLQQSINNTNPSNMESFNRYITQLIPNRAQKVVDNVLEKYEKIKDIIEKNIKPNKYSLSEEELQKLTISISDFDQYKNRILTDYKEYQHQKQQNGSFEDHLHDMHLNKNLINCYSKVPTIFFKEYENENYPFFNDIGRDVRALMQYQNQLVEYLDEVELNLFYQVYFRFNQILEMILNFDKMGSKCEENLQKVKIIKETNQKMKQKLLKGGLEIVKKKKAQQRLLMTYEVLIRMKQLNQNKDLALQEDPKLEQILLNEEEKLSNYSSPQNNLQAQIANSQNKMTISGEVKKSDRLLEKLKSISLYNFIQKKYVQVIKKEEQDHYSELLDGISKYLKENLNYKEVQKKQNHAELSIDISSIHSYNSNLHNDSSSIHYDQEDDIDESLQVFEWTFNDIHSIQATETKLAKLYLKSSHNFELIRIEVLKNNIIKDVQKFQNQIRNQFREYCIQLYKTHNYHENKEFKQDKDDQHAFLNDVNDILLIKFAQFYSKLIQSYIVKSFSLIYQIKQEIITSTWQTEQSVEYWGQKVLPIICNFTKFQIEILDTFSSDLIAYVKYINTSTDANLAFKISSSNELFQYWLKEFPTMFKKTSELSFLESTNLPIQIQSELVKANKDTIQTYDINYFYKQKSGLHFELFTTFDEKQRIILENALSNDNWNPCNISYKIYNLLDYFFIQKKKHDLHSNSDDEEEQFNKIRSNIIKADSEDEEEDLQDLNHYYIKKFEREYKIQLNKLIFEKENKKYMFSEGFLVFLKQVQKYIGIMAESKIQYSKEYFIRFISLLRQYNTFSREFIVLAKGKNPQFPQMNGKVTVKNLATSSLNLTFLIKIFDKIKERLVQNTDVSKEIIDAEFQKIKIDIQNHISEIFGTIPNIIKDMLQKSASQVNLLGWHKPQEKINVPLAQTARIVDSIRSMYNVLEEILNTSELKYIFEMIINDFIEIYIYTFIQLLTSSDSNRLSVQRIKDEVTYFCNEIVEISIIPQLSNIEMLIHSVEQVIQIQKVPRLEEIKNKQQNIENIEDEDQQIDLSKQKAQQNNKEDEIQRITKKFSQLKENDDDQQTEKMYQSSEMNKININNNSNKNMINDSQSESPNKNSNNQISVNNQSS